MEPMPDPGTDLRLSSLDREHQVLRRLSLHALDLSTLGRDVPLHRLTLHFRLMHLRVSALLRVCRAAAMACLLTNERFGRMRTGVRPRV